MNGNEETIPYTEPGLGRFSIRHQDNKVQFEADFGLSVSSDGKWYGSIQVPARYSDGVQGLCGNFDGIRENDYTLCNGTIVSRDDDAWLVKDALISSCWQVDDVRHPE